MARVMVFLMTLMFVFPPDGSSQAIAVGSPGDRIRIKRWDGTILIGTLSTRSAETIQLFVGSDGPMVEVPISTIEALENSLGRRRRFGKYFGLTVASTSIVGAAF